MTQTPATQPFVDSGYDGLVIGVGVLSVPVPNGISDLDESIRPGAA